MASGKVTYRHQYIGSFSTLAALETALKDLIAGMETEDIKAIRFNNSTSIGTLTYTGDWIGTVQRNNQYRGVCCFTTVGNAEGSSQTRVAFVANNAVVWRSPAFTNSTDLTNYVATSAIYNGLDTEDGGQVLDARQGKVLKTAADSKLGASYTNILAGTTGDLNVGGAKQFIVISAGHQCGMWIGRTTSDGSFDYLTLNISGGDYSPVVDVTTKGHFKITNRGAGGLPTYLIILHT